MNRFLCRTLIIINLIGLGSTQALAGGSVSFEERAIPLLSTQPELLHFVQQTLEVARTGDAVRLGKQFGDRVGERIPPFHFEARLKGSSGPMNLVLIIHSPEGLTGKDSADTVSIEIRPIPHQARP